MRNLIILCALLCALIYGGCSQEYEPPVGPTPPDTLIFIDTLTVTDTLNHTDTLIQIDTLIETHYDTTVVIHTDTLTDTLIITKVDTVIFIRVDTVIQVDTVYVYDPGFRNCDGGEIIDGKLSDTVTIDGRPGYWILVFNVTRLDPKPDTLEYAVKVGDVERYISVYGPKKQLISVGPFTLSEHAQAIVRLRKPVMLPKIALDANCRRYLTWSCVWGIKAPDSLKI